MTAVNTEDEVVNRALPPRSRVAPIRLVSAGKENFAFPAFGQVCCEKLSPCFSQHFVLDVCCCAGGITTGAALAGVRKGLGVDSNKKYLNLFDNNPALINEGFEFSSMCASLGVGCSVENRQLLVDKITKETKRGAMIWAHLSFSCTWFSKLTCGHIDRDVNRAAALADISWILELFREVVHEITVENCVDEDLIAMCARYHLYPVLTSEYGNESDHVNFKDYACVQDRSRMICASLRAGKNLLCLRSSARPALPVEVLPHLQPPSEFLLHRKGALATTLFEPCRLVLSTHKYEIEQLCSNLPPRELTKGELCALTHFLPASFSDASCNLVRDVCGKAISVNFATFLACAVFEIAPPSQLVRDGVLIDFNN